MTIYKKITLAVWVLLLLLVISLFVFSPEILEGKNLKIRIQNNNAQLEIVYAILCVIRAFTLIPATPFVITGVLLFPENPDFVLIVSLLTILLAASVHFYLSKYLHFDIYLNKKFKKSMKKLDKNMKKRGILFVFLWTIAPFLPSDPVYYLAGISGMQFIKFILTVFAGACLLLTVYIYLGKNLFEWLFGVF